VLGEEVLMIVARLLQRAPWRLLALLLEAVQEDDVALDEEDVE